MKKTIIFAVLIVTASLVVKAQAPQFSPEMVEKAKVLFALTFPGESQSDILLKSKLANIPSGYIMSFDSLGFNTWKPAPSGAKGYMYVCKNQKDSAVWITADLKNLLVKVAKNDNLPTSDFGSFSFDHQTKKEKRQLKKEEKRKEKDRKRVVDQQEKQERRARRAQRPPVDPNKVVQTVQAGVILIGQVKGILKF